MYFKFHVLTYIFHIMKMFFLFCVCVCFFFFFFFFFFLCFVLFFIQVLVYVLLTFSYDVDIFCDDTLSAYDARRERNNSSRKRTYIILIPLNLTFIQ